MTELTIVGRSSSHYTRTARLFALELGVAHAFRPVLDLTTLDSANYAGNPALKVPILVDEQGPLYGTENICRELVRRSSAPARVVMRGEIGARVVANAEELVLSAMTAEVAIITAKAAGIEQPAPKLCASIANSLDYLERHLHDLAAALPEDRSLSFVEVTLFCLVRHLPFRQIMSVDAWPKLGAFATEFGRRHAALATEYCFDSA